jgi:phosphatidylserine decarboxylase
VSYQPGQFLVASKPEATIRNEQNAVMLKNGVRRESVMCAGCRADCPADRVLGGQGERVQRGERFGLIRFGSRMDTFLPLGSKICVSLGDRVKGGETIVGELR